MTKKTLYILIPILLVIVGLKIFVFDKMRIFENPMKDKYNYCLETVKYNGQKYYDELTEKYTNLNIKNSDYKQKLEVCEQFQVDMPVISYVKDVGPMKAKVYADHKTYLLDDGKVLIANGSIQLFDPSTNTFKLLLNEGLTSRDKDNHKIYYENFVKLPDGNIQIGNYKYDIDKQEVFLSTNIKKIINYKDLNLKKDTNYSYKALEAFNNGSFLFEYNCRGKENFYPSMKACENVVLQDPINKISYKSAKLQEPRDNFTSILLADNNILIMGGTYYDAISYKNEPMSTVELYNPLKGTTEIIGNMSNPRIKTNAIILKNENIIITGQDNTIDIYNQKTKQLKALADIDKIDNKKQPYQDTPAEHIEQVGFLIYIQFSSIYNLYYLPKINKIFCRSLSSGFLFDPDKVEAYPVNNHILKMYDYVVTPLKTDQILITGGGYDGNQDHFFHNYANNAYVITFKILHY